MPRRGRFHKLPDIITKTSRKMFKTVVRSSAHISDDVHSERWLKWYTIGHLQRKTNKFSSTTLGIASNVNSSSGENINFNSHLLIVCTRHLFDKSLAPAGQPIYPHLFRLMGTCHLKITISEQPLIMIECKKKL